MAVESQLVLFLEILDHSMGGGSVQRFWKSRTVARAVAATKVYDLVVLSAAAMVMGLYVKERGRQRSGLQN